MSGPPFAFLRRTPLANSKAVNPYEAHRLRLLYPCGTIVPEGSGVCGLFTGIPHRSPYLKPVVLPHGGFRHL